MEIDERLRYAINSPPVVHESFVDEAVIVNLNSGAYYSLDKCGLAIWNLIAAGASIGEMVDRISGRYTAGREDIPAGGARTRSSRQPKPITSESRLMPTATVEKRFLSNLHGSISSPTSRICW